MLMNALYAYEFYTCRHGSLGSWARIQVACLEKCGVCLPKKS